jgi:molybdopterin-guanine dinucleotide biosynthesis protein A
LSLQGAIIAGGKGSRLGGCVKALIQNPDGLTLLARNVALLTQICGGPPLLSSNRLDLFESEPGIDKCVMDLGDPIGPLGGLIAVLSATNSDAVLFVAGDMPRLSAPVLQSFVDEFRESSGDGLWARHENKYQPFPSILAKSALEPLKTAAEAGERSLWKIFSQRLQLAEWSADSKRALDQTGRSFNNINSPDDLEECISPRSKP